MGAPLNSGGRWAKVEPVDPTAAELRRAAKLLSLRARRQASNLFTGAYTSAFRGSGVEFEELRPYSYGDDVRSLDWNATARRGQPYIKRFREERDQTLLILLDVSASMAFSSHGRSKAALGAYVAALLAAAAGQSQDRVGLVTYADGLRDELPPARGEGHGWRLIQTAVAAAGQCHGTSQLEPVLQRAHALTGGRAVCVWISDLRDEPFLSTQRPYPALVELARRHDLVSLVPTDPRELTLPAAGAFRIRDPERPGKIWTLDSGRASVRERYRAAAEARQQRLEHQLRSIGADFAALETQRDPLGALMQLFRRRAQKLRVAA